MFYRKLFFAAEVEQVQHKFDVFYMESARLSVRQGLAVATVIVLMFTYTDPTSWHTAIRLGFISPILAAAYLFTFSRQFIKWGQIMLASVYVLVAIGLIILFKITDTDSTARWMYAAGLMLCTVGAVAVRLRKWEVILSNAIVIPLFFLSLDNATDRLNFMPVSVAAATITILTIVSMEKTMKDNYTTFVLLDDERKAIKKLKEKLENSDTLKSKLLSIVAHDLKGPTKNTAAILRLLNTGDLSRDEFEAQIKNLEIHMHSNLLLLENLLKWSLTKIDNKTQLEYVDLHDIIEECTNPLVEAAARKGNKIINKVGSVTICTDPGIIKMIVRNLLSNANKFTSQGTITCIHTWSDNQHVLAVADTGVGMSKDCVEKLFDWGSRLSTRGTHDEKGAGIGLLISGEFLQSLGGSIQIDTQIGKGTTVSIGLKPTA